MAASGAAGGVAAGELGCARRAWPPQLQALLRRAACRAHAVATAKEEHPAVEALLTAEAAVDAEIMSAVQGAYRPRMSAADAAAAAREAEITGADRRASTRRVSILPSLSASAVRCEHRGWRCEREEKVNRRV